MEEACQALILAQAAEFDRFRARADAELTPIRVNVSRIPQHYMSLINTHFDIEIKLHDGVKVWLRINGIDDDDGDDIDVKAIAFDCLAVIQRPPEESDAADIGRLLVAMPD